MITRRHLVLAAGILTALAIAWHGEDGRLLRDRKTNGAAVRLVGHLELQEPRVVPLAPQRVGRGATSVGVAGAEVDDEPLLRELPRRLEPDPPVRAGHQCDLPGKSSG